MTPVSVQQNGFVRPSSNCLMNLNANFLDVDKFFGAMVGQWVHQHPKEILTEGMHWPMLPALALMVTVFNGLSYFSHNSP